VNAQSDDLDALWRQFRASGDPALRERLVERFMPLVEVSAQRLRWQMGGKPDPHDLVQAGVLGLLRALDAYDPTRGVSLSTYCAWQITWAMYDDQRAFDWLPESLRTRAQRLRRAADELREALGREPCDEELAAALGIPVAKVAEARRHEANPAPSSLEAASRPGSRSPSPALEDESADPVATLVAEEARALLYEAIRSLADKQRYTLLLYYFERLKLAQIGLVLGVTESRAAQLRKEALATLAERLGPHKDQLLDLLGV